ncbi:MAG: TonB-dependent receptor plug domain-containing protein [Bacteroidota bacterium]
MADTTLSIPSVEIKSTKVRNQSVGGNTQAWTPAQLDRLPANNLAELLAHQTGTYIKSYGLGSLATSSVRGASAGHTLVLWNGLPIQSPMLGQLDLALLSLQAMESVEFTRGGNAALWGSGAIGGIVNLDNQANFSQKLHVKSNTLFGSFGQFQQQLDVGLGNQKIQSVTRLSHQQATNDFYYFLADGLPERQQTNAQLSQQSLLQDLYWKWNDRRQVALHFWHQQSDRQIPPTNVQNRSEAHQDDLATRVIMEVKQVTDRGLWQAKMGFFNEHLNYFDDLILLESRSHFQTYLAEITGQWNWKEQHQFLVGNTHTYTRAWSAGYRENVPSEYKSALFTSWKYQTEKLKTQLSLRQEIVDNQWVPLVPAFGFDFYVNPDFSIKGKVSRNYRLPTFNDRFWLPGGNPDLLPESGWSQELTLAKTRKKSGLQLQTSLTVFNRTIDNWILWSIREGQSFWSANNITKVWSRGLEPRLTLSYPLKNSTLQFRGGYDYIRSTNQVPLDNPKMAAGDQLIYTPIHQAFGTLSWEWKGLYVAYQHDFTGKTDGINDPLESFQVGNIRLQYTGNITKYKGTLFLNFNNLWDVDYLVVERRPMPGIHFQMGVKVSFNEKL